MDRILSKFDWTNCLCYLVPSLYRYLRERIDNVPRYGGRIYDMYLVRAKGNVCIYVKCSDKLPVNVFNHYCNFRYQIIEEVI